MSEAVNANRGLKKFFFYVFLSGFLGFILNFAIQKKLQQHWKPVAEQLRAAGIEASSPRMVYARTGLPVFGAQIDFVRIERTLKCYSGIVRVENVFVPFSFFKLLSGKIGFGEVDIETLKISVNENDPCKPADEGVFNGDVAATGTEEIPPVDAVFQDANQILEKQIEGIPTWFGSLDKWFTDRDRILLKNPLSALKIHRLTIDAHNLANKHLQASGSAYLKFSNSTSASAEISLKPLILRKKEKALSTEFSARVFAGPDNVELAGDWGFNGGHFVVALAYDKAEKAKILLKSQDLPVSVLNKWLDTAWSFQFLWFNCDLSLETQKKDWVQTAWQISQCRINGPNGKIELSNNSLTSLKNPKEVSLLFQNLDLDKIIHGRDDFLLSGIFKDFGLLDGEISLADSKWHGNFELKNSQVVFSSDNKRKLQTFEKMNFEAAYNSGVYSLYLLSAKILKGDFEGLIAVDFNDRAGVGKGKIAIQKLSFADEIEDLMLAGKVSDLLVNGDFELDRKFELSKAQGKIWFSEFNGANLDLDKVELLADWSQEKFRATATAGQVQIFSQGRGQWVLRSLLNKFNGDKLSLTQVHARGEYVDSYFQLEKLSASGPGYLHLDSTGTYGKQTFAGTWAWSEKGNLLYDWKWAVRKGEVLLVPQLPRMKEWLRTNPQLTQENPYIRMDEKDI